MNKATPGPCKEVTIGATPHGGTYMVAYYFDSKYTPVPKHKATRIIIHEYDEKNRSIYRDYISCGPNDEEEYAAMEAYELSEPDPKPAKRRENGAEHRRGEGRNRPRPERHHAAPFAKAPEENRAKEQREEKKPHPPRPRPQKEGQKPGGEKPAREARPQHRPRPDGQKAHPEKQHAEPRTEKPRAAEGERPEGQHRRPRRRPPRKPKAPDQPKE